MPAALEPCLEEDVLAELVHARLSTEEAARAEAHIDACPACRKLLAELLRQRTPSAPPAPPQSQAASSQAVAEHILLDAVLPPGTRVGRFFVREPLGHGGMGVVYMAYDQELQRDVALKLVRPRSARKSQPDANANPAATELLDRAQLRLLREAQAMARLSHPNVRAVYEVGAIAGQVYIAMELVNGVSAREYLRARPRSLDEILALYLQAGQGLRAAHEAGLLHRDVKPDNILVSSEGRVRITDFGLARSDGTGESGEGDCGLGAGPSGASALSLTQSGTALGTPGYIAPEQLRGAELDARADQWSFCASLYEALFAQRPFVGATVSELLADMASGPRLPGRGRAVPTWLKQLLTRGLAFDRERRYPSMAALLAVLDRAPQRARARRWVLLATLGVGVLALGGAAAYLGFVRPEQLCGRAARRQLEQAWNPTRRAEIERALLARNLPYGRDTLRKVSALLDAYAERWLGASDELCQSARPRRALPEAAILARSHCLELRRRELSALTAQLLIADAETVERAVSAAGSLASLESCRGGPASSPRPEAAGDPALRAQLEAAQGELAQARALHRTGHPAQALARLEPTMAALKPQSQRALWAELAYLRGGVEFDLGKLKEAESSLHEAVLAGEASGQDELLAMAWLKLVEVGTRAALLEQAEGWHRHASAVSERLGGDLHLLALRENLLAMLRFAQGRRAEARELQVRAVALLAQSGAPNLETAKFLTNLGAMQSALGQHPEALVSHRRAVALFEGELGPAHPAVGNALLNLGAALGASGDNEGEIAAYERCLAIWESALGKEHVNLATAEQNLGTALRIIGKPSEALRHFERALAIKRRHLPADHPSVASTQFSLGAILHRVGRSAEGLRRLEDALHTFEARLGSQHPLVAKTLTELGLIQLDLHHPEAALPILERALHTGDDADLDPVERAETRFGLARALRLVGREPTRAAALARQALRDYDDPEYAKEKAEVSAWLAQ